MQQTFTLIRRPMDMIQEFQLVALVLFSSIIGSWQLPYKTEGKLKNKHGDLN